MDILVLSGVAVGLFIVLLTIFFLNKKEKKAEVAAPRPRELPQRLQQGVPIRAQIARNQRARARTAAAEQIQTSLSDHEAVSDSDDSDGGAERLKPNFAGEKMGAKKRAKLEAKADKKLQREAELAHREDKKKRDAIVEEEQQKLQAKERLEEQKLEEAERLARELKEKQEYEEYLQMKAAFSVEEEGYEDNEDSESDNLLQDFINYIKDNKVVLLEELARAFKLKTQAAIDRIQELKSNGSLTGVLDDRGKFIYISADELSAVAKFIRQRGRISITELAESSNNLINLAPVSMA